MSNYLAYIDESGDPNFNVGASKTFLVAAVVIPQNFYPDLSDALSSIKKQLNINELKSNKIQNFNKRLEICKRLSKLDLRIATIYVEKDKLQDSWCRWRTTFYKYIQKLLHHEIYRLYGSLDVSIDKYGSPQYQTSFKKYIVKQMQQELFEPVIKIESAKLNEFIQVSDFIAGTVRKAIECDFPKSEGNILLDLFRPKWQVQINLPDFSKYVKPIPANENRSFNACIEEAWRYLEKNDVRHYDPKIRTLEYLYYSAISDDTDWLYTQEILKWLHELKIELSEEQFRNEVTAALRDEGLVIVSSRKGLKIPVTADDIQEYIQFSVNLTLPVLKRLKKAITFVSEKTSLTLMDTLLSDEMKRILDQIGI